MWQSRGADDGIHRLFQFTYPRGVRLRHPRHRLIGGAVSIHAPARGATTKSQEKADELMFQFTHPRGVRPSGLLIAVFLSSFQFTHPRGVRLRTPCSRRILLMFQFTHPRGVRRRNERVVVNTDQFQFTHPRGVRHRLFYSDPMDNLFQFTHPRGCDRWLRTMPRSRASFNSRTHEGATAGMGRWLWSCLYRPALAKVLKLSLLSGAAST